MKSIKDPTKFVRTIKLQVHPDATQIRALRETGKLFASAFNTVSQYGWDHNTSNGVMLHHATYHPLRQELPTLGAQLLVAARAKATGNLKALKTIKKKGKKVSCPRMSVAPDRRVLICYDARSSAINLKTREASLNAVGGKRLKLRFDVCQYYSHYLNGEWEMGASELKEDKKGNWYLHVSVNRRFAPKPYTSSDSVLGVDLGIVNLATDSENNFYGSDHWKVVEDRRYAHNQRLQSKGTPSAKRRLRRNSGSINRFRQDCDHVISKALLGRAVGGILVLEDLTDIRDNKKSKKKGRAFKKRLHRWSFARLKSYIEYKAPLYDVCVEFIDPAYTSTECSECGCIDEKNRVDQATFKCAKCGFAANADYNGACVIKKRYLCLIAQRAAVNQPIVIASGSRAA